MLLRPGGQLWFSTNLRSFTLDQAALSGLTIEPMKGTIPPDFARKSAIHQVFVITRGR